MIGDYVSGVSSDMTGVLASKGDWNTDKHVKKQGENSHHQAKVTLKHKETDQYNTTQQQQQQNLLGIWES